MVRWCVGRTLRSLSAINGLGVQADEDWYKIYVSAGYEKVLVDLQFTHADGDINLKLYNSSGTQLAYSDSDTDNESIDYTVSQGDAYYYLKVYYDDAGNTYDLWWDDVSTDGGLPSVSNVQVNPTTVQAGDTQTVSWQSNNQAWYFF